MMKWIDNARYRNEFISKNLKNIYVSLSLLTKNQTRIEFISDFNRDLVWDVLSELYSKYIANPDLERVSIKVAKLSSQVIDVEYDVLVEAVKKPNSVIYDAFVALSNKQNANMKRPNSYIC